MRDAPDPDYSPYPGEPVLARAWNVALNNIGAAVPTPSVVPGEEGTVQLIWHKAGWDLELEIDALESSVWARNRSTGETWHGSLDEHWQRFSSVLRDLAND
jgi:hypothetical protein